MAATLRRGSSGNSVAMLQRLLNEHGFDAGTPDGVFGPKTEDAVEDFQDSVDIFVDGIAGTDTWNKLATVPTFHREDLVTESWEAVPATKLANGHGMEQITLRESSAAALMGVLAELSRVGAILTSAGGRRRLAASVGKNRSRTSLHYTGRAFDLAMYSGMVNPETDPYVVVLEEVDDRKFWRVFAACNEDSGVQQTLTPWTYKDGEHAPVTRRVIDLTMLLSRHGFGRIPARRSFFRGLSGGKRNDGAAEWWHFQDVRGLHVGVSKFGPELCRVWTDVQLAGTGPWSRREYTWTGYGFEQ
jgi:hypothetical protein